MDRLFWHQTDVFLARTAKRDSQLRSQILNWDPNLRRPSQTHVLQPELEPTKPSIRFKQKVNAEALSPADQLLTEFGEISKIRLIPSWAETEYAYTSAPHRWLKQASTERALGDFAMECFEFVAPIMLFFKNRVLKT